MGGFGLTAFPSTPITLREEALPSSHPCRIHGRFSQRSQEGYLAEQRGHSGWPNEAGSSPIFTSSRFGVKLEKEASTHSSVYLSF